MLTEKDINNRKNEMINIYRNITPIYEDFKNKIKGLLIELAKKNKIKYHQIEGRTKSENSFIDKAILRDEKNPAIFKYSDPIKQITDLIGIRIIVFFIEEELQLEKIINKEFMVIERIDKSIDLLNNNKFGYQSVHYLIKLNKCRQLLDEYSEYKDIIVEIQVRTILQHAWAEIEHDIQYKNSSIVPLIVKRRFAQLAGLLEIADREFQAIQSQEKNVNEENIKNIKNRQYSDIQITISTIEAYLNNYIGVEKNVSKIAYENEVKILLNFGFTTIEQVYECTKGYDANNLSKIVRGTYEGKIEKFELVLLASMGDNFLKKHLWKDNSWFIEEKSKDLKMLRKENIIIGSYKIN